MIFTSDSKGGSGRILSVNGNWGDGGTVSALQSLNGSVFNRGLMVYQEKVNGPVSRTDTKIDSIIIHPQSVNIVFPPDFANISLKRIIFQTLDLDEDLLVLL